MANITVSIQTHIVERPPKDGFTQLEDTKGRTLSVAMGEEVIYQRRFEPWEHWDYDQTARAFLKIAQNGGPMNGHTHRHCGACGDDIPLLPPGARDHICLDIYRVMPHTEVSKELARLRQEIAELRDELNTLIRWED